MTVQTPQRTTTKMTRAMSGVNKINTHPSYISDANCCIFVKARLYCKFRALRHSIQFERYRHFFFGGGEMCVISSSSQA